MKRLKGTRDAAAAEDEGDDSARQGPAATGLSPLWSVINGNKSSHRTGRGHGVKPAGPPLQMRISDCVFTPSLLTGCFEHPKESMVDVQ